MDEQLNQQSQEGTGENSNQENREQKYKTLQSDYTKKSQELKELKSQWSQNHEITTEEQRDEFLQQRWFVKKDDVYNIKKQIEQESAFNDLLSYNPELNKYADAIRALSRSEGLLPEEIIEKYKFWSIDKLQRAKERKLIWDRTLETQPKSISDLSPQEYEDWKKQHTWHNKREKRGWF